MHRIAAVIVLLATGCVFDTEDYPHISNLACQPTLDRTAQPLVVHCTVDIENDGGNVNVQAFGQDGTEIMTTQINETTAQGRGFPFQFKLATPPPAGTLTLHVTVFGWSDGNDSNELSTNISVQ